MTVVVFTFATINKTNTANKTKTLVFKYRFSDWNYLRHEFKFKSQVSMVKIIKVYVYFSSTKVNSDFFASNSIFDIEVLRIFLFSDCGSEKQNFALKICRMYKLCNTFQYVCQLMRKNYFSL